MAVKFINVENGREHIIIGGRVLTWIDNDWRRSEYLREADMAHYPFIGVKVNSTFC